jgi:hypothetical protein
MDEREQAPGHRPDGPPGPGPEAPGEDPEAAMMRDILRRQERHREGGVEPELAETGEEPGPEA